MWESLQERLCDSWHVRWWTRKSTHSASLLLSHSDREVEVYGTSISDRGNFHPNTRGTRCQDGSLSFATFDQAPPMDRSPIIHPQTKESPSLAPTRQTVVMNPHFSAALPGRLVSWQAGQYLRLAKRHIISLLCFAVPHISPTSLHPPICKPRFHLPKPSRCHAEPDKTYSQQPIGTARTQWQQS